MQNDETIVAIFDTADHAAAAVRDLKAAGVADSNISQHAGGAAGTSSQTTGVGTAHAGQEPGFWASLFGAEPEYGHDTAVYDRSLQGGSTVVTVRGSGSHLDQVLDILERHNPIDIDERAATYGVGQTGLTGASSTGNTTAGLATGGQAGAGYAGRTIPGESVTGQAVAGQTGIGEAGIGKAGIDDTGTIQLSEETLAVGKRAINRGTTRVRRYVVETPVEEQVSLHEEHVSVERRPVTDGRAVASDSFGEKTIEVTETAEEAVVSKTARVKEEIVVRKEAADRTETVRDTVRREDVEITKDAATAQGTTGTGGSTSSYKPAV